MYSKLPAILLLAALSAGTANAGGYVGIGLGQSTVDICDDLKSLGATSCDDEDNAWKLFGGYAFNPNFAIEAGWADFGEVNASDGFIDLNFQSTAFTVDGKVTAPLTEIFSVFAKMGVAFWKVELDVPGVGSADDDGQDFRFGFGGEIDFTPQFAVRAEWERNDFDGTDVDLLSASAILKF